MPYIDAERLSRTPVNFILGAPRSGTTLLTTILNANDAVLCLPETKFTLTFLKDFGTTGQVDAPSFADTFSQYTALRFRKLTERQEVLLWQYDQDVYYQLDAQQIEGLTYRQLMTLLLLNMGIKGKDNERVQMVVDKEPDYTFWVPTLLRLFPEAKFLVAMRDYRSVVLSNKESGRRMKDVTFHGYTWLRYAQTIMQLQRDYPDRVMLAHYEQMVQDTESNIKKICDFFNITFQPEMLTPHQKVGVQQQDLQKNVGVRDQKRIGDLIKPINTNRLEAWKKKLSPTEIADVEALCGSVGQRLGYQPTSSLSVSQRASMWLRKLPYISLSAIYHLLLDKQYYHIPYSWRRWAVENLGFGR